MSTSDKTLAEPALLMRRIRELDGVRLRSEWLSRKDKVLMQMIFDKGGTFEQIARLTGQNPSTISRRFHTLLQKLIARELVCLLRHREGFDESAIRMFQEYYLRGLSQNAIAQKFGISLYRVGSVLRAARSIAYDNSTSSNGKI